MIADARSQAEWQRAGKRARAFLKPGDWMTVQRCGGLLIRVKFTGWDGNWICSRALNDISPRSVVRVNGKDISFRDKPRARSCVKCGKVGPRTPWYGGWAHKRCLTVEDRREALPW